MITKIINSESYNTLGNCADYDSMGNHGRFPLRKDQKVKTVTIIKRKLGKLVLWLSYKFPKRKRKSIWDL